MSRFNNVQVLLDTTENYNLQELTELLLDEDVPTEELAEDIAFVLISMWSLVPESRKIQFKESLTDEMVNLEIAGMFPHDEE